VSGLQFNASVVIGPPCDWSAGPMACFVIGPPGSSLALRLVRGHPARIAICAWSARLQPGIAICDRSAGPLACPVICDWSARLKPGIAICG
jgi:hypothetical protein